MLQNCEKSGKNTEILPFHKQKCKGRIISQQRVLYKNFVTTQYRLYKNSKVGTFEFKI